MAYRWQRKAKTNKYNAKKVSVDGIEFDSKKEARRYQELLLLQKAGEIYMLERQKVYELLPAQREPETVGKRGGVIKGKLLERAVEYVADFVYTDKNGKTVVEDVKGFREGGAYAVFVLKRKLMLYRYGIKIIEV